jgi:cation diffusion facilitator CzcD-associated flavoprotein CzcO
VRAVTRVAIVGTGFGGLAAAVRLKQAGFDDLVLFEKSADVGGVWRDNTYPGAACDVPSHLYSLSFAPKADWSRRFAPQAEIHQYLREVARGFDVLRHIRFDTEVLAAAFDDGSGTWRLTLSGGAEHEADVLITATGQLSRPSTPDIPGLDRFEGTLFHSARWDHDHDLSGERVAVLGTGASAIQLVPAIAPDVASLAVFQRSAPYVLAKPDRAYDERERRRLARMPALLRLSREGNYFSNELRSLGFNTEPRLLFAHRARYRKHLREAVADPELRAKLTPTDPMGCKRILMSNDWYPALQQPQVEVVTDRIAEVRAHSIVTADGTERPVDTIVLGTGFAATEFLAPMSITGRGGRDLHEQWKDGASAYLGTVVPGFPNLFVLYGPNTNLGHNSVIVMLEAQVGWVVQAVRAIARGRVLDVRRDVAEAFDAWVQERLGHTVFAGGCRSWYLTASGRNTQNWPASTLTFRRRLRRLRLEEFAVDPVCAPAAAADRRPAGGSRQPPA